MAEPAPQTWAEVSPAVASNAAPRHPGPSPRRRRRAWPVVALLLLGVIVVALIGQLNQPHGTAAAPPTLKGKHKVAAQNDPATVPPVDATPTHAAAQNVYIDPPPDAPDAQAGVEAVQAAMQAWSRNGRPLQQADGPDGADVTVRFVVEWAGFTGTSPGIAEVGLGDSRCDGTWMPYTADSLRSLAALSIGRALGEPDSTEPGSLMDANAQPHHDGACTAAHGTLLIAQGAADGKRFRTSAAQHVAYTMQEEGGGYADVCLVEATQWDAFAAGEGSGSACHYASSSESDGADLPAGDYILGFRCVSAPSGCRLDYTLSSAASS